jgi:hypothetical protein
MDHTEAPTKQDSPPGADHHDDQARFERPDQRAPRGNQDVEQIDVERGQGNIERVLGW